jgi:hypothetical protein
VICNSVLLPILISAAVAAGWLLDSAILAWILALNLTMRCDFIDYRPGALPRLYWYTKLDNF